MAISRRSYPFRSASSSLAYTLVSDRQRWNHSSTGENGDTGSVLPPEEGSYDQSSWKTVDSRAVGIRRSSISSSTWTVLNILQRKGFDAYLVGGCVRDLLLKKTPKDFDVITNATLKQIKKQFRHCIIVGRRFPICQVHVQGSIVEVSTFDTNDKDVKKQKKDVPSQVSNGCDVNDFVRWKNSMDRDFTINRQIIIFLRTVIPAHLSFDKDCARILRGLRIVARLGLQFSKETAAAIRDLSSSILTLNESRLRMELNFMLAYGAAESSIRLLHKFKLLDILLPIQAAYLADQSRKQVAQGSTMLMKLFSNADKLLAADHPADSILWLALLAFHLALVENPQDALVVWTFSAILHDGTWKKAAEYARKNVKAHAQFVPEIRSSSDTKSDELILEETSHLASLVKSSVNAFTSIDALQQSLGRYQGPLSSGVVLVSERMGSNVSKLLRSWKAI
ncbi:Poly A polymerase head domain [Musa troglodytarum]|uniref:Poly A polymerase head domain n=1 Tax=Musa troglodytarum TaxID=320322 RepID=A0A9E7I293_9LILI|nr:Poly A polymerase head domain [Musa troglodytarum]